MQLTPLLHNKANAFQVVLKFEQVDHCVDIVSCCFIRNYLTFFANIL